MSAPWPEIAECHEPHGYVIPTATEVCRQHDGHTHTWAEWLEAPSALRGHGVPVRCVTCGGRKCDRDGCKLIRHHALGHTEARAPGLWFSRERGTTDIPSDLLGGTLALLGNQYGAERLLARAHELYAEDPTVIADLRHEVESLERQLAIKIAQGSADDGAAWPDDRCGVRTETGDLECRRRAEHDGLHVGGIPSVTWGDRLCGIARLPYPGVPCTRLAGHDGGHIHEAGDKGVTWSDDDDDREVTAAIVCGETANFGHVRYTCSRPDGHEGLHLGPVAWGTR